MADIDDFDIDRSIAQAWTEFQSRLSEIISMIDDSADLRIGTQSESKDTGPFVTLSCPSRDVIRAEASSNATLGASFQLSPDRLAAMQACGWQPPTAEEPRPTPHFWVELPQEESERLSELTVSALKDVYGVQHPIFLAPDQLAEVLQPDPMPIETAGGPALSGPRIEVEQDDLEARLPRNQAELNELVADELTAIHGYPPIRDSEGDVAIRVGSTMLFLRTSTDGQEVVIFAPVVHDVSGRSRATEVLNDLNVEARWVKFQLVRDRVFVTVSVQARPFVPAHLHQAVRILSDVADGIDDELASKLNGRTTFSDRDDSH